MDHFCCVRKGLNRFHTSDYFGDCSDYEEPTSLFSQYFLDGEQLYIYYRLCIGQIQVLPPFLSSRVFSFNYNH